MTVDLPQFDGKLVRIVEAGGASYVGRCEYLSDEYNLHEYGHSEPGLMLACFLFYEGDIADVIELEEADGPYRPFSDPYGTLEEEAAEDPDLIDEFLTSEDDDVVVRMLRCLHDCPNLEPGCAPAYRDTVLAQVRELAAATASDAVAREAARLLERWG